MLLLLGDGQCLNYPWVGFAAFFKFFERQLLVVVFVHLTEDFVHTTGWTVSYCVVIQWVFTLRKKRSCTKCLRNFWFDTNRLMWFSHWKFNSLIKRSSFLLFYQKNVFTFNFELLIRSSLKRVRDQFKVFTLNFLLKFVRRVDNSFQGERRMRGRHDQRCGRRWKELLKRNSFKMLMWKRTP